MKSKITLMILGSLVAFTSYGVRTSDSYTIGAEGLLPQTSLASEGYVLEGTLAPFSGLSSDSYTLIAGANPGSIPSGPPIIETDLEDQDLLEGDTLTLMVVATGPGPYSYMWTKGETVIEGAESDTLVIEGVTNDDEGGYFVTVSNSNGEVNSLTATITVLAKPVITVDLADATGLEGGELTLSVEADIEGTPSFRWVKDDVEIEGATEIALALAELTGDDEGRYRVYVSNEAGEVQSRRNRVRVTELPSITQQPQSVEVIFGGTATFRVSGVIEGTGGYQWFKDGVAIDGATSRLLAVQGATPEDEAAYTVELSNEIGSVLSDPATLTLFGADPEKVPGALVADSILISDVDGKQTYFSGWFGEYHVTDDSDFGWVWTKPLGWTYFALVSTPEASYTYPLLVGGIFYIAEGTYPDYAYSYNDASWVLLNPTNDAETGSIWGWVYELNEWVEYSEQ